MGVMRQSWKDFTNATTYSVPVNTNPSTPGQYRLFLVVNNYRTDVVRVNLPSGAYDASIRGTLTSDTARDLTVSYDGTNLTLEYSATIYGGIRVLLLD